MIVDLHLREKLVLIAGGGKQALKKVKVLLSEECSILVVSKRALPEIEDMAVAGRLELMRADLRSTNILQGLKPFAVLAVTDDSKLNLKVLEEAKKAGALAFSSDCPQQSDFASVATIGIGGIVDVAVSTGGRSPIMAEKLKSEIEPVVRSIVTDAQIGRVMAQHAAREMAREAISDQGERRRFLYAVMDDPSIERLIKDGKHVRVRSRIADLLKGWR